MSGYMPLERVIAHIEFEIESSGTSLLISAGHYLNGISAKDAKISALTARNEQLEARIDELEAVVKCADILANSFSDEAIEDYGDLRSQVVIYDQN